MVHVVVQVVQLVRVVEVVVVVRGRARVTWKG